MIPPIDDNWFPWFIDIITDKRDDLMNFLKAHNIQTRVTYTEINKTDMYNDNRILEVSNYISSNGLFLPSHTLLKKFYICNIIKLFYNK